MRRILTGAILLFSAGCSTRTENTSSETSIESASNIYVDPLTPPGTLLILEISLSGDPANPTVSGKTNLPRGTKLNVAVEDGKRSYSSEFVDVADGVFSVIPNASSPALLPGKYDVVVSSPLADIQPTYVRDRLGAEYENLTGPLLRQDDLGRLVYVNSAHTVPGKASAADVAKRDADRKEKVRLFYEGECINREKRYGRPTLTPKAKTEISNCVAIFMAQT